MKTHYLTIDGVQLRERDLRMLELVAKGATNRQIVERLLLSMKTVEKSLGNVDPFYALYPKIGVSNRAGAAAWFESHRQEIERALRPSTSGARATLVTGGVPFPNILDILEHCLLLDYRARKRGEQDLEREIIVPHTEFVKALALSSEYAESLRVGLYRIWARMLLELAKVYTVTETQTDVRNKMDEVLRDLKLLRQRCADDLLAREVDSINHLVLGILNNITGHFTQALFHHRLVSINSLGTDIRFEEHVEVVRDMLISFAALGERYRVEVEETKGKLLELVLGRQCQDLGLACFAYDAIARASLLLGLEKETADALADWKRIYDRLQQIDEQHLRTVQLSRTETMAAIRFHWSNPDKIIDTSASGLLIANKYHFRRHRNQLVRLLSSQIN